MSQRDGFSYYYSERLGLETKNFLVQYDAGLLDNYSGTQHLELNRSSLSFPQEIQHAATLNSNVWTHFFVYNKTNSGQGILFSSLQGPYPYSGYTIGTTDDNKIYFESYDNNGPVVRVGKRINSQRNAIGVGLLNNSVSFNYFDFEKRVTEIETFNVQGNFIFPHSRAFVGGNSIMPAYTSGANFPGTIDNYIYVTASISPHYFDVLFSGFYSYYDKIPGIVTTGITYTVTGYEATVASHSGITGYETITNLIGTGDDGSLIYQYDSLSLSGLIFDGTIYVPQTGTFYNYTTGNSTYNLIVNQEFVNTFTFDRITLSAPSAPGDINFFYGCPSAQAGNFNLLADYNLGNANFELDSVYDDQETQLFLNGNALVNDGYSITGNVYSSGYQISGDYILNKFAVMTRLPTQSFTTVFSYYLSNGVGVGPSQVPVKNVLVYDYIPSGQKRSVFFTGSVLGENTNLGVNENSFVFLDGIKLNNGIDYNITNSKIHWLTNAHANYQGTGLLSSFTEPTSVVTASGQQFGNLQGFQKETSRIFHNGSRLILDKDYVENSHLDFLKSRSIIETGLQFLYNDNSNAYFE